MSSLNPQQQEAIRHRTGPLLILAGAGTGKTRVVTERIAMMLREGVRPENILGVTFTNKAAGEMRSRLKALAGKQRGLGKLVLSTFHSLCVRMIRHHAELIGLRPGFTICAQGEQLAIVKKAAMTVTCADKPTDDELLMKIGGLKNKGISQEEFARQAMDEWELALSAVYRRYQDMLRRQNSLDFDDLLLFGLELMKKHPEAADYWRNRFHYIMVDEFQDTNQVQFDLIRLLSTPKDNLAVVGDDDQSIYAWRGAMAGNILKFNQIYPAAKVVTLEQNYRSTSAILSSANAVIKNNGGRREKNLWSALGQERFIRLSVYNDQFEEASAIASAIRERLADGKARHGDFAVIIRANAQARPFEDEFMASRIPYEVIGGQSLYDRKEARDVLSFLSIVSNPEADNQLLRIINIPPRGIGDKTVDLLSATARQRNISIFSVMSEPESIEGLAKAQIEACRNFSGQVVEWREKLKRDGVHGLVKTILDSTKYTEELSQLYANPLEAASRWNEALDVGESLVSHLDRRKREYGEEYAADPNAVLSDFLQSAALVAKADSGDSDNNAVKIITAHSAKGLEFKYVFIPGMEEELFPHKNSIEDDNIEEERRLFYVAMTRARLELDITYGRGRVSRGKDKEAQPSRFLAELPEEFLTRADAPTKTEVAAEWLTNLRSKLG